MKVVLNSDDGVQNDDSITFSLPFNETLKYDRCSVIGVDYNPVSYKYYDTDVECCLYQLANSKFNLVPVDRRVYGPKTFILRSGSWTLNQAMDKLKEELEKAAASESTEFPPPQSTKKGSLSSTRFIVARNEENNVVIFIENPRLGSSGTGQQSVDWSFRFEFKPINSINPLEDLLGLSSNFVAGTHPSGFRTAQEMYDAYHPDFLLQIGANTTFEQFYGQNGITPLDYRIPPHFDKSWISARKARDMGHHQLFLQMHGVKNLQYYSKFPQNLKDYVHAISNLKLISQQVFIGDDPVNLPLNIEGMTSMTFSVRDQFDRHIKFEHPYVIYLKFYHSHNIEAEGTSNIYNDLLQKEQQQKFFQQQDIINRTAFVERIQNVSRYETPRLNPQPRAPRQQA